MIDKGLFNNGMTTSEYDYYISKCYESPIKQIMSDMQYKYEEDCVKVVQSYGFDVDKEELTKALLYDRNQYEKGYQQGREDEYNRIIGLLKYNRYAIVDNNGDYYSIEELEEQLKEQKNDRTDGDNT